MCRIQFEWTKKAKEYHTQTRQARAIFRVSSHLTARNSKIATMTNPSVRTIHEEEIEVQNIKESIIGGIHEEPFLRTWIFLSNTKK